MFQLQDSREREIWQEAYQKAFMDGFVKGFEIGLAIGQTRTKQELTRKWLAKGMSVQDIADLLEIPLREARRLVKDSPK